MLSSKIKESEVTPLTVASLPTRPTAPTALGGKGYNAVQMKEAFDRLPLFIIERFNQLYEDITAEKEESIANLIDTGIKDGHNLRKLFDDILSGELASYMTVFNTSLSEFLGKLRRDVDILMEATNEK